VSGNKKFAPFRVLWGDRQLYQLGKEQTILTCTPLVYLFYPKAEMGFPTIIDVQDNLAAK